MYRDCLRRVTSVCAEEHALVGGVASSRLAVSECWQICLRSRAVRSFGVNVSVLAPVPDLRAMAVGLTATSGKINALVHAGTPPLRTHSSATAG